MAGIGNEALFFVDPVAEGEAERRRREQFGDGIARAASALALSQGGRGAGVGAMPPAPTPKAADYATSWRPPNFMADDPNGNVKIPFRRPVVDDVPLTIPSPPKADTSLAGVVSDLPGGGWNQAAADSYQKRQPFHTPAEAAQIASRLESAASNYVPWQQGGDDEGSLGRMYQDERARGLIGARFDSENERIDREAAANDPQKRDLESRRLNAAADEFIARERGQRLPTLGGVYNTKRPEGWTPGLFEVETDAAGRDTFVNAKPQPAHDPKMKAGASLMQAFDAAIRAADGLPKEQRDAYLEQVLIRMGFQGELMGLGKDMLRQVAAIIAAQGENRKSALEAETERLLAAG